jgi:hypothetical protein
MAEEIVVVIEEKFDTIISHEIEVVVVNDNAMPGPPGPPGIGGMSISADSDNTITLGSDNGIYCSAVLNGQIHW